MNFTEEFDIIPLIRRLIGEIRNAQELLGYIDNQLSRCRDEKLKAAYRRMRTRVQQSIDEKELERDRDILRCLAQHGCILSDRHLRRILAKKKLGRKKSSDIDDVASFVNTELEGSGQQHGYRFMWQKLKNNGLNARKDDVRLSIRCLDPEGVFFCEETPPASISSGPNFIWPKVFTTNNGPKIIGGYFLEAIAKLRGCPRIVRGDAGTENVNVRRIHSHLMGNGHNGCRTTTYIKSKSTSNQIIECSWGQLKKQCAEYWIVLLSTLEDTGNFAGDFVDKSLCQFCLMLCYMLMVVIKFSAVIRQNQNNSFFQLACLNNKTI
ncbi:hypothetical protein CAPTEDRAFT_192889 [Capitella teleta]|uniref:Integrase core domain-containing protein n=1 Tax=Capitella teleta TaxID=283909 RepID=R7TX49_CAPTE|nr:hypothetical protein CAPTEDRAFT_192889 [Capitella teleta]|eukprot:ELT98289.1 hypothetical protein CAPTEDRAFT_192889 [Capitella teleta]